MKNRIAAMLLAVILCLAFASCSASSVPNEADALKSVKRTTSFMCQNKTVSLNGMELAKYLDAMFEITMETVADVEYTTVWEAETADRGVDVTCVMSAVDDGEKHTSEFTFNYNSGDISFVKAFEDGEEASVDTLVLTVFSPGIINGIKYIDDLQ